MSDPLNIDSFMEVINRTQQDERGIFLPGELMPSGKPVRADGVAKAALMKDKGMALTWYESIRGQYAREEEEGNHKASTAGVPELVIQGNPAFAAEPRGVQDPVPQGGASLEEELQGRRARWLAVEARAQQARDDADRELKEARTQIAKVEAALDAIRQA